MDATVNSLRDIYDQLDPQSQAEALRHLNAQAALQKSAPVRAGSSMQYEYNWIALCNLFPDEKRPLPTFVARFGGAAKFRTAMERLDEYIDNSTNTKLSRTHRLAMTTEVLRCLVRYMRNMRVKSKVEFDTDGNPKLVPIPVNPRTVLDHLAWLPNAVDRAFPGYSEARLLDKVVLMAVA